MSRKVYTLLTLLMLVVACGCKKNNQALFPEVRFEEFVYLNLATSEPLQNPSGWIYANGGYNGLLVYRRYINNTSDDFAAYDRGCPEHYNEACGQLTATGDGVYAECSCNGERYLLFDGSPADGASLPLRPYPVSRNGEVLYISN